MGKIKKIMGVDCSSTTIGWSLLEINENDNTVKFIKCDNLKPIANENIVERLHHTRDEFKKIIELEKPDYIAIEDIIQYMQNKSSAKTIITLALFNRMICLTSHDYLNRAPELYNVLQIRHGIKLSEDLPKKEDIPELVAKHLGIKFPYIYKKNGKIAEESCDMADGVAVALYYAFILTGKLVLKPKKSKKSKTNKIKKGKN